MGEHDAYRALVEQAPTMMWRLGRDARCEYVNAAWLTYTGRTLEEALGAGWSACLHPDDREHFLARFAERFAEQGAFEWEGRLRRHDGVYRHHSFRAAPYRDRDEAFAGFVGSAVDVGARRRADAVSGAAEFFEMSLDNLCVVGFDGNFRRVSPSWTRTLGWTEEELLSRPSSSFAHPDDREGIAAAQQELHSGRVLWGLRNRYRCRDGSYRWFEWRSVADVERRLVYAAARDVTEELEAQQALQELTESLTATLDSIADGVVATDAQARVTRMNPVAEALTGWSREDALGEPLRRVFQAVDPDTGEAATPAVERTMRDGAATGAPTEAVLVARDGARRPVASSWAPIQRHDGEPHGAVLVFRDKTAEEEAQAEHQRMQQQLLFADRMASVGTLAAGVAHEINNPLAYVLGNLDLLFDELSGGEPVRAPQIAGWREAVREAREGAGRIKKIVRGLGTFSRVDEERPAVVDVEPVLELSIDMAFNEIRHRARLVRDYGETPRIEVDEARLGQVVINLLVNAAQALPDGGARDHEIRVATATGPDGEAVIEVCDSGPGIPADKLERIFDPFFTTKPVGVGTGLGLSICHTLVASMGGRITAANSPGGGARFRVVLPPAAPEPEERPGRRPTPTSPERRKASILVVDDERAVGVSLARVLREHDVTTVTSARDALSRVLPDGDFDVILSDLMMPEMSGMEFYDAVARDRPEMALRMVFMSGGAFTPAAKAFLDRVPNDRFEKPFEVPALRELVARFLD